MASLLYKEDSMMKREIGDAEYRRRVLLPMGIGLGVGLILGWIIDDLSFGALMGLLVGMAFGSRGMEGMRFSAKTFRGMLLAGAFLVVSLFLMIRGGELDLDRNQEFLVALIPVIPSVIFAYTIAKAIGSLDELQRRIQLEAIGISFAGTMIVVTSYGMLERAGISQANWGFVTLLMVVFWLIGKLWTMWKYR
jgi:hypothetical protein